MRNVLACIVCILAFGQFASAGDIVGWRLDGTGQYPGARPPATWSTTTNVLWATSMPDWSNASPVIAGSRLFVQGEPFKLYCIDANSGRLLWTRSHEYEEVMTDADKQQAAADKAKADAVREKIKPHEAQLKQFGEQLRKLQAQATQPDANAEAIAGVRELLKKQAIDVGVQIEALKRELAGFTRWDLPPTNEVNGYSSCTPVTDGQHVWCLFGNGVAACYDMAGQRKWIRFVAKSPIEDGLSSSPLLADDKLLVHIDALAALNPETGETLWQAKDTEPAYGTPAITDLGGESVAITCKGDVVRVRDGHVLARKTGSVYYCSPVVRDGVAYFVQFISKAHGGGEVVRLTRDGDTVTAEKLWQTAAARDRYYASPIIHNGLVYIVTQANVFSSLKAADGSLVKELRLELGKGTTFPSMCLVDGLLYVSSDNGNTAVIRPGPAPEIVRINTLEPFRATPLFVGGRIYVRGLKTLYCLANRLPASR